MVWKRIIDIIIQIFSIFIFIVEIRTDTFFIFKLFFYNTYYFFIDVPLYTSDTGIYVPIQTLTAILIKIKYSEFPSSQNNTILDKITPIKTKSAHKFLSSFVKRFFCQNFSFFLFTIVFS